MKVRRAGEGDIPRITELLVQVDMVHHRGRPDIFKGPAVKYSPEELKTLLREENRPVFVAEDATGRIVGHAFCILREVKNHPLLADDRTLYIDDICVDEACRGQGAGRALFVRCRDYARERGCRSVTLNVWAFNGPAMHFYEELGMKPRSVSMEMRLDAEEKEEA